MRHKTPMPKPDDRKPRPAPVHVETVDLRVWERAMELAQGDVRRIKRIDSSSVLVVNQL